MSFANLSPEELAEEILGYITGRCVECSQPLESGQVTRQCPEDGGWESDICLPCDIRANPSDYPEGESEQAEENYRDWLVQETFSIIADGNLLGRLVAIEKAAMAYWEEDDKLSLPALLER